MKSDHETRKYYFILYCYKFIKQRYIIVSNSEVNLQERILFKGAQKRREKEKGESKRRKKTWLCRVLEERPFTRHCER